LLLAWATLDRFGKASKVSKVSNRVWWAGLGDTRRIWKGVESVELCRTVSDSVGWAALDRFGKASKVSNCVEPCFAWMHFAAGPVGRRKRLPHPAVAGIVKEHVGALVTTPVSG